MRQDEERVDALHRTGLLDTPPEDRFDRVVRLACRLFDVPTAAVNLVDRDRQFTKASVGVDLPDRPLSASICASAIQDPDPLVIEDLTADERFRDTELVQANPGLRFYAGQPLVASGQRVGTLCVFDERPRSVDDTDLAVLRDLAGWIEKEMALDEEMVRGGEVQRRLLPRRPPTVEGYDVVGRCLPAREVGGDFYDWFPVDDEVQVVLGDVMGKGIGSAIIAASVRALVRGASRYNTLGDAVTRTAATLEDDLEQTTTFVTLFCARLEPSTGRLEYVDAGHGLSFVLDAHGGHRRLESEGLPLGVLPGSEWKPGEVVLEPGHTLVAVSDGTLDFFPDPAAALDALVELNRDCADTDELVVKLTELTARGDRSDDVTMFAVRRHGTGDGVAS